MHTLILTPDGVGSTILQRLITIHLHMNNKKVSNTHELTNGIKIDGNVAVKDFSIQYNQRLEDVASVLDQSDKDINLVSRLAKYHIDNRADTEESQQQFFNFIKLFFGNKIMCLRRNVFEYALSWSIRKKSGLLNINSTKDRAKVFQVDTVDEDYFIEKCRDYVNYLDWMQYNFHDVQKIYYEDVVTKTDEILELITEVPSNFIKKFGVPASVLLKKEYEAFNSLTCGWKMNLTSKEKKAIIDYKMMTNKMTKDGLILNAPVKNTTLTDKKNQIKNFNNCLEKFYNFARNHNWIDQSMATFDFWDDTHVSN